MADIHVSKEQLQSVSQDDRDKITQGLRVAGALGPTELIVDHAMSPDAADPACAAACTATYESACAFCAGLGGGAPAALCYAAATAAYGVCLASC